MGTTDATAETDALFDSRDHSLGFRRVIGRDETDGFDRARPDAATTAAAAPADSRKEICRVDRVEVGKSSRDDERFATTPAAVTDEADMISNILAELNEPSLTGLLKDVEALAHVGTASKVMLDQRTSD